MEHKIQQYLIKGMQRDMSISKSSPEYSFENMNIRITARDNNTLLSLTNEKGNKEVSIPLIQGTLIGHCVLNKYIVLFTTDNTTSRIYRIEYTGASYNEVLMIESTTLGFDTSNPIETIGVYETEDIQKVYWTDGLNQPRVINIISRKTNGVESLVWNEYNLDFIRAVEPLPNNSIVIERNNIANGIFAPGVIQYSFSYYNTYGQESNIFYTSPLYYTSYSDRGGSAEDRVGNSFTITLNNLDTRFEYVRVYATLRTSLNGTVEARRVVDLAIPENGGEIVYVDNGTQGDSIDPTQLLYIGGESISAYTMAQKDNTLFLGNIKLNRPPVNEEIRNLVKDNGTQSITFGLKEGPVYLNTGTYPYKNQLETNSQSIKTLKYNEYYRFGLQFQDKTGKWSEAIWIGDYQNTQHPIVEGGKFKLPKASRTLASSLVSLLMSQGYTRVRPVIVYPTLNDRTCICQGMVCPTVYNVGDRGSNSPFAQSSWFARPISRFYNQGTNTAKIELKASGSYEAKVGGRYTFTWGSSNNALTIVSIESGEESITSGSSNRNCNVTFDSPLSCSIGTVIDNLWKVADTPGDGDILGATIVEIESQGGIVSTTANAGVALEYRHDYPIPASSNKNSEIQSLFVTPLSILVDYDNFNAESVELINSFSNNFYVDQSIVTLHSPDLEFNQDLAYDLSGCKFRITGYIPMEGVVGDIDIQTSTSASISGNEIGYGFYKEDYNIECINTYGNGSFALGAFIHWIDHKRNNENEVSNNQYGWVVYPFHRNGSLNDDNGASDRTRDAMLQYKRLSNLKVSTNSMFLASDDIVNVDIFDAQVFNSNEVTTLRLNGANGNNTISYYGNVDKVLTPKSLNENVYNYPIYRGKVTLEESTLHDVYLNSDNGIIKDWESDSQGSDAIRMVYNSTPHIVLSLGSTPRVANYNAYVLPAVIDYVYDYIINEYQTMYTGQAAFWDNNCTGVMQPMENGQRKRVKVDPYSYDKGIFFLGELYRDYNPITAFGGSTIEALTNNEWIPCGEPITLEEGEITVEWTEGDTYYQRYDCLKTYAPNLELQNGITEIVSFMCETRVNIDGRYDRNRGQITNFAMTPTNFNLLNDVYSQDNNFFVYRALNYDRYSLNNFPNSITWTLQKSMGELTDTWTNITMANTLDLDGDKGEITSLNTFNNEIYCFQSKAISNILYNSRMQIPVSDGVPIEISSGTQVQGKRYVTNTIGCNNKWSIVESPQGLYFIDNLTNSMYLFNGKIDQLSDRLGFRQWIGENNSMNIWNPVDFDNFIGFYDKSNGDVYFTNDKYCLCFSELLGQFTSFMSYEKVPAMFNVEDKFIAFKDGKLWEQFEGDYNMFFGEFHPYYITYRMAPDFPLDKIFSNIEFRADSWDGNKLTDKTFNTLNVWNEYQSNSVALSKVLARPSNLKQKFRIWRANIPRDISNGRDRIRSPWIYLQLVMDSYNKYRTELHDLILHYYE